MPRRPRVLVAIRPLLLADLVRSALPAHIDVVVRPVPLPSWRRWDVAVVPHGWPTSVRARHVVTLPSRRAAASMSTGRDFRALVALVQGLCDVRSAD